MVILSGVTHMAELGETATRHSTIQTRRSELRSRSRLAFLLRSSLSFALMSSIVAPAAVGNVRVARAQTFSPAAAPQSPPPPSPPPPATTNALPTANDTTAAASEAPSPASAPFTVDAITATAGSVPPPARMAYLQYGIAFTAEFAAGGAFCDDPQLNCILGSGGGIAGRFGWRSAGDWYLGGAYELSKQDPTKLYRLAILQQLRAEARHYWWRGKDTQPLVALGAGLAGYGNEWGIATWGPTAFAGVGIESQLADGPVLGFLLGYRPIYFWQFEDTNHGSHGPGFAHMFGIDLTLEARDPITP